MNLEHVHSVTDSVCPECLTRLTAQRVRRGGDVFLRKTCPEHGTFETIIWRGSPTFTSWVRPKTPAYPQNPFTEIEAGCPYDCGLCPDHRQQTCTALLEVTQRCNLGCPVCFASSGGDVPPDPGPGVIEGWYRRLLEAGGPYNVQLSGGEPTLRDDLPEIVRMGRALGFDFIQVNTNGLRFATDPDYVAALADAGLSSVFLQFDGTEDDIYRIIRGRDLFDRKLTAVEACARHNIGVILVPTVIPGVNLHNLGTIIDFALAHMPTVRGVHFQPVSYFGRYPQPPTDADRVTIPEVIRALEQQTDGRLSADHFQPPGCENALCSFHANYVLMADDTLHTWGSKPKTGGNCCCGTECQPESAAEGAEKARAFVAQKWVAPQQATPPQDGPSLGEWDAFLERARTHAFSVSGMAFQDAWTLDLERLADCCIHVVSPDGRIIPFCAYNLTSREGKALYRGPYAADPA